MDSDKELGGESSAITSANNDIASADAKAKGPTATILASSLPYPPIHKRRWFRVSVTIAAIAAFLVMLSSVLDIPNVVMGWVINYRELFAQTRSVRAERSLASFSVSTLFEYVELEHPRNLFFWNVNGRRILSPIHVEMLVDITNLEGFPLVVKSYQFEGKTLSGDWEPMTLIDTEGGRVLWLTSHTGELTGTILLKVPGPNVLPGALKARRIEPKDTVEAFAFLEAPKGGFTGEMRLRIRYANDVEEVQPVLPPVAETNLLAETPMVSMTEMFKWPEGVRELPIIRYSEE